MSQAAETEPTITNEKAFQDDVQRFLDLKPSKGAISSNLIKSARTTGAWFYWCHAVDLLVSELTRDRGASKAIDVIYGDDPAELHQLRAARFSQVIKDRFGYDMSPTTTSN